MNKKYFFVFALLIAAFAVSIFSCTKAGLGGTITVVAFPQHHTKSIKRDTVWIKFNTSEAPANPYTDYDVKYIGDTAEEHVHCTGLKPGKYFFSASGYDSTLGLVVRGGLAVKIKTSQKKTPELDIYIPVTE